MKTRIATVIAAVATIVAMFSAPALALQDDGSLNCGSQWVMVRSYATEDVFHFAPYSNQIAVFTNTSAQYRYTHTGLHSTTWKVVSDLTMNYTLTTAYCVSYS
jgi:hypothetical protein